MSPPQRMRLYVDESGELCFTRLAQRQRAARESAIAVDAGSPAYVRILRPRYDSQVNEDPLGRTQDRFPKPASRSLKTLDLWTPDTPSLIGCICNTARLAIRKGFMDKAAGTA
jgi:hypothetical protein